MRRRTRRVGVLVLGIAVILVAGALVGSGLAAGAASSSAGTVSKGKTLDLVWISDSSGWGVARFYARQISKALKVTVRVHDEWEGNLSAAEILKRLSTPRYYWIPMIRNAEVIFVTGNPYGLEIVKGGDCVTSTQPPLYVGPKAWPKYIAALKAIYKRIFEIRQGVPVILRTANWYVPVISHAPAEPTFPQESWDEAGITDICTQKFESFSWAIGKAASAYRVPVADVYTAFNGKGHREDPFAKGYIQADGIHPNDTGRAVIAKTLAALGYKQVKAPR